MKVKAKVSFSGILTMSKGQTADLPENETLQDLMNAGYVEAVEGNPSVSKADISPEVGESSKGESVEKAKPKKKGAKGKTS